MDNELRCEIKTTVCRRSVSNASEAQALFKWIGSASPEGDYRALFVIESALLDGSIQWRELIAEHLPEDATVVDTLPRDRSDELTHILGSETRIAVYARDFDAGLFAAVLGSVRQRGVLIWITQPLDEWARTSRYGRRLVSLLDAMPIQHTRASPLTSKWNSDDAMREQDEILAALNEICAVAGNAVAVVEGKRGRGKSTLLGRLASELTSSGTDFLITAAYRGAVQSVEKTLGSRELPFVAADQVLDQSATVLLVDEAANISLDILKQWVLYFPKVILASTVEGYESAGRGFTIRFAQWLDEHRPDWQRIEPVHPWRWRHGDSLEWFVDRLLLSSDKSGRQPPVPVPDDFSEAPTYIELSQTQLASDHALLQSVYELLRSHHYQTSVLDLQHLLDAENLSIFVAVVSGQCVAASLVATEGELDASLHDAIVAKRRRISHQLLPQLLAQTANQATALSARYARVVRIAVAPVWRRRRIASDLLHFIECSVADYADIVGASFADSVAAKAFWQQHDYLLLHQGYRQNPRSGARSLAVYKALESNHEVLLQNVHRVCLDNHYADSSQAKPSQARSGESYVSTDPCLSDKALLARLARGERNVYDTLGALRRLVGETPENANWLEQLYERLGCHRRDSQQMREKTLKNWLLEQTMDGSTS